MHVPDRTKIGDVGIQVILDHVTTGKSELSIRYEGFLKVGYELNV